MPRKAPDTVQETRITFGNYERQFVTEVKTDIEKAVKVAVVGSTVATVGTGLVVAGGVGYMGFFIMKGLQGFSLGIDDALDPVTAWYNKWFKFTNSETGKRESVATNFYDYVFNNQEAEQMRADNPLPSAGDNDENDLVDWDAIAEVVGTPVVVNDDEGMSDEFYEMYGSGNSSESDDESEGSNWPFTTSWWPF